MSRETLISAYVAALPFAAVAIIAIPGGRRCRVSNPPCVADLAPGEKIAQLYYFKPTHLDLVLGAAGLGCDPIEQPPDAVAALIERTARRMGAPYETEPEIRAAAEQEVAKIVAKVAATNQAGGLAVIAFAH